jgi:hypothetical protein
MSITNDTEDKQLEKKATIYVTAAIVLLAALLVGGFIYIRKTAPKPEEEKAKLTTLENAIRPNSPEWKQHIEKIVLDPPEAVESKRAVGDIWMQLQTTVRNFTGRTITGLEMKGAVVDLKGNPVKEKTLVIIPGYLNNVQITELDNNKTARVPISIDGFKGTDVRANIKMEITGFKLQ